MLDSRRRRLRFRVAAVSLVTASLTAGGIVTAGQAQAWEHIDNFPEKQACEAAVYWYVEYKKLYKSAWCFESRGGPSDVPIWYLVGEK